MSAFQPSKGMYERFRFPREWCRVASPAQSWWKKRAVRQNWLGQPGRRGFGKHSYCKGQLPAEPQRWKEHPNTEELNAKWSKNICNELNMNFLLDWPETNCGKRNSQLQGKYSDTSLPEGWNGEKAQESTKGPPLLCVVRKWKTPKAVPAEPARRQLQA